MSAWTGQTLGDTVEWHLDDMEKPEVIKTIRWPHDPLADVVALYQLEVSPGEIFAYIQSEGEFKPVAMDPLELTAEHFKQAKKIRTLFKNRMIFRRLQSLPITEFMKKLERILESENSVDSDCVAPLVRLPDFYQENVETSSLLKRCASIPSSVALPRCPFAIDSKVRFEGKIFHKDKNSVYNTYFWSTTQSWLIAINVRAGTTSKAPWDFISKLDNVGIRGDFLVSTKAGYEFNLARPFGESYEIYHT